MDGVLCERALIQFTDASIRFEEHFAEDPCRGPIGTGDIGGQGTDVLDSWARLRIIKVTLSVSHSLSIEIHITFKLLF